MAQNKNWLDKVIGFVSPSTAAERMKARLVADFYERNLERRKYEGASVGRRTDGWVTPSSNANAEIKVALAKLRDRSRDLTRNNPIANRALQTVVSNVVGTGIIAQHRADSRDREIELNNLWSSWAEKSSCDIEDRNDFYGLQSIVMRTVVESGECLVRKIPARSTDGMTVPLKIQVLEPDFLDSSKDGKLSSGGSIIQGVEFNAVGQRVAYWIYTEHPGAGTGQTTSVRVPSTDVIHIFRQDRPGQARGVPWASPVIVRLKDLDDYMDSTLVRQKIAACFTAFVYDMEAPLDSSGAVASIGEKVEPGQIEILPPGKDVKFGTPPGADGSSDFIAETLRMISGAYGISYESLTNDYSRVNYSSGRMGWIEMSRNIDSWRWHLLIPQFCEPVWKWFTEAASIVSGSMDGIGVDWSAPRREMIDPTREIPALITGIRGGLISLSEVHRQSGFNSDNLLEEIARDNDRLDALGLVIDADPRKTMKAGIVQSYVESEPEPESTSQ